MEYSGLFFLNWKIPCGFIYHPRNQKKKKNGRRGLVSLGQCHLLRRATLSSFTLVLRCMSCSTVILWLPVLIFWKSHWGLSGIAERSVFRNTHSIRKRFVVVPSFPSFSWDWICSSGWPQILVSPPALAAQALRWWAWPVMFGTVKVFQHRNSSQKLICTTLL